MKNTPVVLQSSIGTANFDVRVDAQSVSIDVTPCKSKANEPGCKCRSESAPLGSYVCQNGVWKVDNALTLPVLSSNSSLKENVEISSLVIVPDDHVLTIYIDSQTLKSLSTSNPLVNVSDFANLKGKIVFNITDSLDNESIQHLSKKRTRRADNTTSTEIEVPVMNYNSVNGSFVDVVTVSSKSCIQVQSKLSQSPSSLSATLSIQDSCGKSSISKGAIAGIIIGVKKLFFFFF